MYVYNNPAISHYLHPSHRPRDDMVYHGYLYLRKQFHSPLHVRMRITSNSIKREVVLLCKLRVELLKSQKIQIPLVRILLKLANLYSQRYGG